MVVGGNRFTSEEPAPSITQPDYSGLEQRQKGGIAAARRRRDQAAVGTALAALAAAASGSAGLMDPIIAAVRARATLGEISDALRGVWGTYRA